MPATGILKFIGGPLFAGAVVTKDVEPYTLVGGIPAVKIAGRPKDLNYNPADRAIPFI